MKIYHHVERVGFEQMQFDRLESVVSGDGEVKPAFGAGLNILILAKMQLYFLHERGDYISLLVETSPVEIAGVEVA